MFISDDAKTDGTLLETGWSTRKSLDMEIHLVNKLDTDSLQTLTELIKYTTLAQHWNTVLSATVRSPLATMNYYVVSQQKGRQRCYGQINDKSDHLCCCV